VTFTKGDESSDPGGDRRRWEAGRGVSPTKRFIPVKIPGGCVEIDVAAAATTTANGNFLGIFKQNVDLFNTKRQSYSLIPFVRSL
jgi:hypothetical protein